MNQITINGKTITVPSGTSVSIQNNQILVGGKTLADGLTGVVKIKWEGPAASIVSDVSIECGDVDGDVRAGNSVSCKNVQGNVRAGNSVWCVDIGGSVEAGNSVNRG